MAVGFPDWTRAVRLLGIDADGNLVTLRTDADGMLIIPIQGEDSEGDLQPVLVDSSGRIIMVAHGTIEVGGELDVNQTDSIREVQGAEGENLRTLAVDSDGQLIMVPRGQAGNYMAVDASGFLTTILKGIEGANLRTLVVDSAGNLVAVMKGIEGANLRTIAVDASGRIIMVPYGTTTVEGTATVTQAGSIREVQGKEGANLRTLAVDASGQLIMVPRGQAGNYMAVDASGFLTTILKGIEGANLRTLVVDSAGNLVAVMKGIEGANLRTIAVDASGRIIMVPYGTTTVEGTATVTQTDSIREVQGKEGANLRTLAVDASGQIIMVPRGQSGYYLAVDDAGHLSAIIKGEIAGGALTHVRVDASGQLVMVPRGQSGNYLAVDSDGYMTTVIKGLYGALLKTLAVDEQGRIYGYQVDDLDQWGKTLLVGNAEQAARLGSVISWDRRGQVQLINDFSHGMGGYTPSGDGAGWGVALDPSYFQAGGYSVKLTGGSDGANRNAGFTGSLGLPPSDTVGFALRWSGVATPDYLRMQLTVYKAGTAYFGYIRYDFDNDRLQYMDSGGTYQDLAVQEVLVGPGTFNSIKLVIDADASKYVRALLNDTEYDLSAYALLTAGSGIKGQVVFSPMLYSHTGDNDIVYIDYIAITTRED